MDRILPWAPLQRPSGALGIWASGGVKVVLVGAEVRDRAVVAVGRCVLHVDRNIFCAVRSSVLWRTFFGGTRPLANFWPRWPGV